MLSKLSAEEIKKIQHDLFVVVYRMTKSVADSEDLVQEVLLSCSSLGKQDLVLKEIRYYLIRSLINRCFNLFERQKRQTYIGPDLPEPLADTPEISRHDVRFGTLLLLQRLNPYERAVWVLKECFNFTYDELSELLGKTHDNCRQLFHRANTKIQIPAKQHAITSGEAEEYFHTLFIEASKHGNLEPLINLLKEDVVAYADGGGKVSAAIQPIYGLDSVAKYLVGLLTKFGGTLVAKPARFNQTPAIVFTNASGNIETIMLLEFTEGKIAAIYLQRNPDKIKH